MVDPDKQAVLDYISAHEQDAIALFQQLVRTKSANPPGDEKDVAEICATYGRACGMIVDQFEPEPKRVSNLMRLSGSEGHPVLLFNSHLDTFPPVRSPIGAIRPTVPKSTTARYGASVQGT